MAFLVMLLSLIRITPVVLAVSAIKALFRLLCAVFGFLRCVLGLLCAVLGLLSGVLGF
jgi:hypothetical protein